jgi:hypothetical protein
MSRRWTWEGMAVVLLLAISLILGYALLSKGHAWGDDFSSYIGQAKAICAGAPRTFVAQNRFTIENSSSPMGPIAYPWGTALLLAPLYRIFGLDILALKLLNPLLYAIFLISLFVFLKRGHSLRPRLLLIAFFALSPYLLGFLDNVLSDVPFLLLSTITLTLIGRLVVDGRRIRSPRTDAALLGALMATAFFFRFNGVLLLGALGGAQATVYLRHRRLRNGSPGPRAREILPHLLPYAVFAAITLIWYAILPDGGSNGHAHPPAMTLSSLLHNLRYYARIPEEFFKGTFRPRLPYLITLPLMLAGMLRRFRHDFHLLVYWALTFALFVAYPGIQGLRYLFPALPLTFHFVFAGAEWGLESLRGAWARAGRILAFGLALAVIGQFAFVSVRLATANLDSGRIPSRGPFTAASAEMFAFVRDKIPPPQTVEFFKPRAMHLLTGRPSIMVDRLEDLFRGDYLCHYLRLGPDAQLPIGEIDSLAACGRLAPIFSNGDFRLYRIEKPALPERVGGAGVQSR